MTTMTDNEWRSFVTAGTKLAHIALTRPDGRPHVTPVCFILDGDELAFALSPGSVKGNNLARDRRIAICVSDERQPYSFVPSKEKHKSPPSQTESNTSQQASPTATTPPNPQRSSLNHSYRQASPQFESASAKSSHDPASADTSHARTESDRRVTPPVETTA
jgi:hypothetical protein